jgi:hypothetical protein
VAVAIKNSAETLSLAHNRQARAWVGRDDGPVEDLAAGKVGVQVDVRGQDEVLIVVFGRLAEGDQIGGRGDLVRIVRLSRPAAVLGCGAGDEE